MPGYEIQTNIYTTYLHLYLVEEESHESFSLFSAFYTLASPVS